MGKRLDAEFFLNELDGGHEAEGCNYLLALEMEMDPVPGYAIASWERGYGDFSLKPDVATLRPIRGTRRPRWSSATSSGTHGYAGAPLARRCARRWRRPRVRWVTTGRCSARSSSSSSSASYLAAHAKHYHDLYALGADNFLDYHILGSSYDEPFLREARTS